ncbi:MAG: HD domain-containing protein [Bacillota bacterium]
MKSPTLQQIKTHPMVTSFIQQGDVHLASIGFTEHSFRHAGLVSHIAENILIRLGYPERDAELAAIAGFLHDIGNVVAREYHGQTSSMIAFRILDELKMPYDELGKVIGAIGNHEEQYGHPVNHISAALILADKSDVHRTRVRNREVATFDIHDRVNYAAERSFVRVDSEHKTITFEITIDTKICPVMEYFEIFLTRLIMSRRAAAVLDTRLELEINGSKLL